MPFESISMRLPRHARQRTPIDEPFSLTVLLFVRYADYAQPEFFQFLAEGHGREHRVGAAPGERAHATFASHDAGFYDEAECRPVPASRMKVYPPDQSVALRIPFTTGSCSVWVRSVGTPG